MSNYKAMAERIRKAKTVEDLNKCEDSLTNLYNNGIFTVSDFSRLDLLVLKKRVEHELNVL